MSCVVGVWLIVLASSSTLNGKVPRLILKKNKQAATLAFVFFRRHFLCGVLLCNCSSAEREGLYTHLFPTGMFSRTFAQNPVTKNFHIYPRFSPTIFYRDANSVLLQVHFCTAVLIGSMRRTLCSKSWWEREGLSTLLAQRECSAEPSMRRTLLWLRIFSSPPGSRQRFLIPMQIQYSYDHTFAQQ